jgi:hypothetical protein
VTALRLVLMTYVGAAGLIGLGIVASLLLTTGGWAIPSSMQPLSQMLHSIVPGVWSAATP